MYVWKAKAGRLTYIDWLSPWPTKDTAVYVTFEGQKLRGQFSENLSVTNFRISLWSGDKIPKKKELWKFWELKMKIWQKF